MTTSATSQPLSDDEFDRLAESLDSIGAPMNLEAVDGYFAALICGPDIGLPSEYLPQISGQDFSFDSDEQAGAMIAGLTKIYRYFEPHRRSLAQLLPGLMPHHGDRKLSRVRRRICEAILSN